MTYFDWSAKLIILPWNKVNGATHDAYLIRAHNQNTYKQSITRSFSANCLKIEHVLVERIFIPVIVSTNEFLHQSKFFNQTCFYSCEFINPSILIFRINCEIFATYCFACSSHQSVEIISLVLCSYKMLSPWKGKDQLIRDVTGY